MRAFWDARARENAMWYIHTQLDYDSPDADEFWRSGGSNLDHTLDVFGLSFAGDERVVEIGCGAGRITRAIAARVAHVVGVDVSAEMIDRAKEGLADVANAEFAVGNGLDLEHLPDGGFDVAYSFIVFQHIPDPTVTCGYIAEMGRVLKPGGWALFQVSEQPEIHQARRWTRPGLRQRLFGGFQASPEQCLDPSWLGSALSREQLLSALESGGLTLDKTVGDGTQFCLVLARKPAGARG
jgi:SAM-dependent methyltransferase